MDKYSWPEPMRPTAFPIARPGYAFLYAGAFITAVFALLEITALAMLGLVVTLFVAYFFRDPDRVVPDRPGAVVSPADGKVLDVATVSEKTYYDGDCKKVSIFMSVFNVHVNRIPCNGKVTRVRYTPGKFFAADRSKASTDNERNAVFIEAEGGRRITTVQVAGLIARRIICDIHEEAAVRRGQRYGMICFGSRLDLYLPPDCDINVQPGDRVAAGTSIVGVLT
jgi:phosphatidylserine decarboxylase